MRNNRLFIMVGLPGSGKSTWCKNNLKKEDKYISRDEIRFNMVKEDEQYFSKEKEVYKEFCKQIKENLENGYNVYADATHLTIASRQKLVKNINIKDIEIIALFIDTPLLVCLDRNNKRKGKEKVPEDVIKNMFKSIELPNYDKEKYLSCLVDIPGGE